MAVTSRARIRAAVAALVTGTAGIGAVYTYEPYLDDPALAGTTYVIVDLLNYTERPRSIGSVGGVNDQLWVVMLHLVQQSTPANANDDATRQSLQTSIDTVRDALETALRGHRNVQDGLGMVGFDFRITDGLDGAFAYASDRTVVDSWIKCQMRVQQ